MALRSGLETETTWALNALNALLYDDMAVPLNLNHSPALLNVIVEHFRAQLAILFPKIFKVCSLLLQDAYGISLSCKVQSGNFPRVEMLMLAA